MRHAQRVQRLALVLAILTFVGGCGRSGGGGGGGGGGDITPTTAREILLSLGVAEVDSPPPAVITSTQATTEAVIPGAWHPLRTPYATFSPSAELFQAGMNGAFNLFDHGVAHQDLAPTVDAPGWAAGTSKTATRADLDGDGIDEVVTISLDGAAFHARVLHEGAISPDLPIPGITPGSGAGGSFVDASTTTATIAFPYLQSAAGDLDGDGQDELVLVDGDHAWLIELDAAGLSARVIGSHTFGSKVSSVTVGDIDGDGVAELGFCTLSGPFAAYDAAFNLLVELTRSPAALVQEARFGDYDGDRIDELALCDVERDNLRVVVSVIESAAGVGLVPASKVSFNHPIPRLPRFYLNMRYFAPYRAMPTAVDIDGDGAVDLWLNDTVYRDITKTAQSLAIPNYFGNDGWVKEVSAGDIDGDGRGELVFLVQQKSETSNGFGIVSAQVRGLLIAVGWTGTALAQDGFGRTVGLPALPAGHTPVEVAFDGHIYSAQDNTVALVAANVDHDSFRVRYLGPDQGHRLVHTDPIVLAVLVSPPYWESVKVADAAYADSCQDWETFFGQTTRDAKVDETSTGFKVGVTVEFEQEFSIFGLKGAQFKSSASFAHHVDWRLSTTHEEEVTVQRNAVSGEDKVIFTSIPTDVYSYEVVDADGGAGQVVGKHVTISVPREFLVHLVTRKYFNERNGTVPDIDPTHLVHRFGDPFSYHTKLEKDALLARYGGFQSSVEPVTQGEDGAYSGLAKVEFSYTDTVEQVWSVEDEIEASLGGGGGGLSVLLDAGFKTGSAYGTAAGQGASFGGTVGYLPTRYYDDANYSYLAGLFAYPYFDEQNYRLYWVVDYWVEKRER